jgi:hypothetical protein
LLQHAEDCTYVAKVVHLAGAEDQDVVEEHQYEAMKEQLQDLVHMGLKGRWCVGDSEWHDEKLIEPIMCSERHLVHVCREHPNLMIA